MVVNDSTFISVVCRIKTTITKTGNEYFHKDYVYMCAHAQSCLTLLQPHGLQPTSFPCPWDFPGKNTGVGCHFLLQGIFPPQGSNSHLLRWQEDSLLSHRGSPLHPLINCEYKFCFPEFCDLLWQFNRTRGGHCGNL